MAIFKFRNYRFFAINISARFFRELRVQLNSNFFPGRNTMQVQQKTRQVSQFHQIQTNTSLLKNGLFDKLKKGDNWIKFLTEFVNIRSLIFFCANILGEIF
jgi:hypothetical protein